MFKERVGTKEGTQAVAVMISNAGDAGDECQAQEYNGDRPKDLEIVASLDRAIGISE